jgi:hypothetical protein
LLTFHAFSPWKERDLIMAKKAIKVQVGAKFHSSYADANPLWVVKRKVGAEAWEAVSEDIDYGGMKKLFSTEDIQRALAWEEGFRQLDREQEAFYDGLKAGQRLHYCNGFKQYVECIVVISEGKKQLKPVGLKGEWREWDLPRRMPDGSISHSYHANKIKEGKCWRPSISCILESPCNGYKELTVAQVRAMPWKNLEVEPVNDRQGAIGRTVSVLDMIEERVGTAREDLRLDKEVGDLKAYREKLAAFFELQARALRV